MARGPRSLQNLKNDLSGFLNLNHALTIIAIVITAVVGLFILAALAPMFFQAIADLVGAFNEGSTNSSAADSLLPVFALLVAFAGVFALVGLAILVVRIRRTG